jgi:hypothetical protein
MRCRGQSIPRLAAVPDAGGAPLAVLAPDHLSAVWSSRLLLMQESSRGATACGAASEDLAAPVPLCGAMASGRGRVAEGGWKAKGFGCASSLERGAAVAMCCEGGEGAFSAKLYRSQGGHGFQNIALDATVQKCLLLHP